MRATRATCRARRASRTTFAALVMWLRGRVAIPRRPSSSRTSRSPGLEQLLGAAEQERVDVILTEDVSRISRDLGDASQIFKRLQFAGVPLISISDGIDTSAKHAKLNYAVKSLLADLNLDDLRDKTLRGLEGRALAGLATGQVPYGYRSRTEAGGPSARTRTRHSTFGWGPPGISAMLRPEKTSASGASRIPSG